MNTQRKIRILMTKLGLDGHERGIMIVGMALRDAGMEVIYSGIHQTPEEAVAIAVQEGVDLIGISTLSGGHLGLIPRLMEELRSKGASDIDVIAGGIIPEEDIPMLKEIGVKEVFGPGTPIHHIVDYVKGLVKKRECVSKG
jgi:methylmalonyl-CoA mutase, C-terminal domain